MMAAMVMAATAVIITVTVVAGMAAGAAGDAVMVSAPTAAVPAGVVAPAAVAAHVEEEVPAAEAGVVTLQVAAGMQVAEGDTVVADPAVVDMAAEGVDAAADRPFRPPGKRRVSYRADPRRLWMH
ncbi:hypothetical protein AOE01nite_01630 [Acetobacter oeni]|uniref:Lipoyl-binding domain-containing protein n=1 Tax=Acetobacter oeni TaxID=304077 RepID=A0A511XG78_9PROT|nr:hypothetical protein AA21952_0459 [Acetobacter oeni LMG 21952]GEN61939.1 hypothetical protein AOE01nite_01630 [Acetobacter oeni]